LDGRFIASIHVTRVDTDAEIGVIDTDAVLTLVIVRIGEFAEMVRDAVGVLSAAGDSIPAGAITANGVVLVAAARSGIADVPFKALRGSAGIGRRAVRIGCATGRPRGHTHRAKAALAANRRVATATEFATTRRARNALATGAIVTGRAARAVANDLTGWAAELFAVALAIAAGVVAALGLAAGTAVGATFI
jgi:hypothetical protein